MQAKDSKCKGRRYSYTRLNEVYLIWTKAIDNWQHLLKPDENKMIVIKSLDWLVQKQLVKYLWKYNNAQPNPNNVGAIVNEWQRVS